jgi:hypothetical protein
MGRLMEYLTKMELPGLSPAKLIYFPQTDLSPEPIEPMEVKISCFLNFIASAIVDLNNLYIRLEVERTFLYTNNGAAALNARIFLGDKHAANFIKQFRICCNDTTITENLDFVYETNILGATIFDLTKPRKPDGYTPVSLINNTERSVTRKYISLAGINNNISITITYEINIPMTVLNLFDKMRYLPTFFGNWTLDIIPTLDNMIMKVISIDLGAGAGMQSTNLCSHIRKSASFQCYGVGNRCYYSVGVGILLLLG